MVQDNEALDLPSPRSAWLLHGDEASYCDEGELEDARDDFIDGYPLTWTCSPRTERGDILFLYFVAPRKAVHFVCRALSTPFFDSKVDVNAARDVNPHQWCVEVTPPFEIEPVSYRELCDAVGEPLNLRGRSGKYIPPHAANLILERASPKFPIDPEYGPSFEETTEPVVGRPELPDRNGMTLGEWRDIPSALLRIEKEVELFIVEPMLKLAGIDRAGLIMQRQFPAGTRFADFAVLRDSQVLCVIEAKQRTRRPRDLANWPESPDFEQVTDYARQLGCPSMLVDCDTIHLFDRNSSFLKVIERREACRDDLYAIGEHCGIIA